MSKAVKFNQYGGIEVLQVVDVEQPVPGPGQVLVRVKAAGINPGEASIRKGLLHERWPATFPSGQGTDLAGVIDAVGEGVDGFAVGDEIIGFTARASQAEFVIIEANEMIRRPSNVSWEVAGSLFVAGSTAYAAIRAVSLKKGDTLAISGAVGGVGSIVVQLAVKAGARVLGLASPTHHQWLSDHGAIPIAYGEGVEERLRQASDNHLDAFIDTFGADYVELAIKLGVQRERIDTIINFEAIEKYGVKGEGHAQGATTAVLSELVQLIDQGELEIPIAHTYPLSEVQEAFRDLEQHHTHGKIVLVP